MNENQIMVHGVAIAVAVDPDGPLAGVLLLGGAGAGKSQTAISLMKECRWQRTRLVADDCVIIENINDVLIASAPKKLSGYLELHGFGPVGVKSRDTAQLRVAFDLDRRPERLPLVGSFEPFEHGPWIPQLPLCLSAPSSVYARITMTIRSFLAGQIG